MKITMAVLYMPKEYVRDTQFLLKNKDTLKYKQDVDNGIYYEEDIWEKDYSVGFDSEANILLDVLFNCDLEMLKKELKKHEHKLQINIKALLENGQIFEIEAEYFIKEMEREITITINREEKIIVRTPSEVFDKMLDVYSNYLKINTNILGNFLSCVTIEGMNLNEIENLISDLRKEIGGKK